MDEDEILTDLWSVYFHEHPKEAEADLNEDDGFDETLRELDLDPDLDSPDQWEEA